MKAIFLLFLVLINTGLYAQSAEEQLAKAEEAFAAGDYTNALPAYQAAAPAFQQQQQWEKYAQCGVGWGNSLLRSGDADGALAIFNQFLTTIPATASNEQIAFLNKGKGAVYFGQNDYFQAEIYLKKALEIRQKANPNNPDLLRDYANLGTVSRMMHNLHAAQSYLTQAMDWMRKQDPAAVTDVQFATIYENMGIIASQRGLYEEALTYFNTARSRADALPFQQLSIHINKARVLLMEKNGREALKELRMGQSVYAKHASVLNDAKSLDNVAQLYAAIGDVWRIDEKGDSAIAYYEKAMPLASPAAQVDILIKLAEVYEPRNDAAALKKCLDRAEALREFIPSQSAVAANFYQTEMGYHQLRGDYSAALASVQQQIAALVEGFDPSAELPSEEQVRGSFSLDYLQNAVAAKARLWYNAYRAGKAGQKELEKALETLFFFDKLIEQLRQQSDAEGTGLIWSELTLDAYANALDICWELWQKTKSEQYLQHAFYFSEKSKAMVLLEAFQKSKATQLADLPAEQVEALQSLKLELSLLQRNLHHAQQEQRIGVDNADEIKQLGQSIQTKQQEYETALRRMESEHPDYYQLKHGSRILDLAQAQALLQADQALLEYFVADSSVYLFKLSGTTADWYRLSTTEPALRQKVSDLRGSIYGYHLSADRSQETMEMLTHLYASTASELYQMLLAPAAPLPRRWMIIPAAPLGDLPFETLLMEKPQDAFAYKQHAYVQRQHITAYCFSATLLAEMRERQHRPTQGTLLAFAPEFGNKPSTAIRGERFALSPLVFNSVEVDNISKIISDAKILKNQEALEARFFELAPQYRILHFATHGMANDKYPNYSLLAFTEVPDSIENEYLYVSELYDTKLQADLVVLSACETGIGKLYRGEGIVSLARAFSYAGAKSLFTTLWSVNDQATSQIIEAFYQYIAEGKDKDEALFLAKNDFIDRGNNSTAHPFLWAPYILVGDTRPMDGLQGGIPLWIWLAGAGLLAAGGAVWMLRQRKGE